MAYTNQFQTGTVYTYEEADRILQGRNKQSKKLANNTYLLRNDNGTFSIRLHQTDIIVINSDNTYTLNSGGWLSMTTKARMNEFAPVRISQNKGVWYLGDGSLFSDGVTVDRDGLNIDGAKDPAKYERELAKVKKMARKYAKDFVQALNDGKVAMPSGGDCWHCALRTDNKESLGDATKNNDHLYHHIEEGYFVPSLLVNAGREAGYRDDQIGLMGIGGHRLFIDPENNIYKYLVKRLRRDI